MAKRPSLAAKMRAVATSDVPPGVPPQTAIPPVLPSADEASTPLTRFFAATRAGKKKVTASLDPVAHKQLRQLGLDYDKTTEALLLEAIRDLFTKYGRVPLT